MKKILLLSSLVVLLFSFRSDKPSIVGKWECYKHTIDEIVTNSDEIKGFIQEYIDRQNKTPADYTFTELGDYFIGDIRLGKYHFEDNTLIFFNEWVRESTEWNNISYTDTSFVLKNDLTVYFSKPQFLKRNGFRLSDTTNVIVEKVIISSHYRRIN